MEKPPYILVEQEDLSPIFHPLKSTNRVKYTCFDVSPSLLVLGASSGGLYIFRRERCAFLQLIPSKEGAVSHIAISPDERYLGFATVRGTVSLVDRGSARSGNAPRTVAISHEHANAVVTALTWSNGPAYELFIGDADGRVSVLAKTVFHQPAGVLMQLDSKIVQIVVSGGMMVVSTKTRCYICDNDRELFRQIGQKLRDGDFGACFVNSQDDVSDETKTDVERSRGRYLDGDAGPFDYSHLSHIRIFCARPGTRLWEVSADGTVLRTHHLKQALTARPTPITFTIDNLSNNNTIDKSSTPDLNVNFTKLYILSNKLVVAYKQDAIYVFDPDIGDLLLWTDQISDIVDIRCVNDLIYAWCKNGLLRALNLLPLEKFLVRMYLWKKYLTVAQLCLEHLEYLVAHAHECHKLNLLHDLESKLNETDLCLALRPFLSKLKVSGQNNQSRTAEKLKSGVYLINGKNRSLSVSPERMDKQSESTSSTSSLPDLGQEEILEGTNFDLSQVSLLLKKSKKDPNFENISALFDLILNSDIEHSEAIRLDRLPPTDLNCLKDLFQTFLSRKTFLEYLKKFVTTPNTNHPPFLVSSHERGALETDWKVSKLIKALGYVVDESTILETLKLNLVCYYLSLLEVLKIFENHSLSLNDKLSSPRKLSIIQFLLKIGQVEQCATQCSRIDFEHLMYLVLSINQPTVFLNYLNVILKAKEVLPELNPIVKKFLVECLEHAEKLEKCSCGFPLPGYVRNSRFGHLGRLILENMIEADVTEGVRLCSRVPWLWPDWVRMRSSDSLLSLLPLLLHLNFLEEIERRLSEWNVSVCTICLRHLIGLHRGECLNCGGKLLQVIKPLSFTQIGLLFLKAIGPKETIELFKNYHEDVTDLDVNFHQAVVLAAVMEKHSMGLRSGVADVLGGRKILEGVDLEHLAYSDRQWGLKISRDSTKNCCECHMPLNSPVLGGENGVVVFKCRHIFHHVCLKSRLACPICLSNT